MEPVNSTSHLVPLLEAHGIACSATTDSVSIGTTDISFQAIAYPHQTPAGISLQLDVIVQSARLFGHRVLIESFAGLGTTTQAALRHAFEKFIRGSLHVLLAAFVEDTLDTEQIEREDWSNGVQTWRIYLGPLLIQAKQQPDAPSAAPDISTLLDQVRDQFLQEVPVDLHWVRLYCMRSQSQSMGREALLDNAPWHPIEQIMDTWPWPDRPEVYSIRLFLVAVPSAA